MVKLIPFLCLSFMVSACGGTHAPYLQRTHGIELHSSTTDLQTLFTKDAKDFTRLCASRMSDVADTSSSGVEAGGKTLVGVNGQVGETSTHGAVDLGGRSAAVLMVREFMYRACELCLNLNLDKETALAVYYRFLDASVDLAKSVQNAGIAAVVATPASVKLPVMSVPAPHAPTPVPTPNYQ